MEKPAPFGLRKEGIQDLSPLGLGEVPQVLRHVKSGGAPNPSISCAVRLQSTVPELLASAADASGSIAASFEEVASVLHQFPSRAIAVSRGSPRPGTAREHPIGRPLESEEIEFETLHSGAVGSGEADFQVSSKRPSSNATSP